MGRLEGIWKEVFELSEVIRTSEDVLHYSGLMTTFSLARSRPPLRLALESQFAKYIGPSSHALHFVEALFQCANLSLGPRESLEEIAAAPGGTGFLRTGRRISYAVLLLVEWIRSRFPGYPFAELPNIHPWSSRALPESFFGMGLPWPPNLRSLTLQKNNDSPGIGPQLGIPEKNFGAFNHKLLSLALRLKDTDLWLALDRTFRDLNSDDHESLRDAWREYSRLAHPSLVESEAGLDFMYRDAYRGSILSRLASRLTPAASAYFEAFERADDLVEIIFFFLSNLVVDGELKMYSEYSELTAVPTAFTLGKRRVSITVESIGFDRNVQRFVYLEDELIQLSGLMYVIGTRKWIGKGLEKLSCILLADSRKAIPSKAFSRVGT